MSDFAKKTGDYRHLSATDISVLALTYMLEKQHVGVDHINTEPVRKVGSRCVFVFKGRAVDVFFFGGVEYLFILNTKLLISITAFRKSMHSISYYYSNYFIVHVLVSSGALL